MSLIKAQGAGDASTGFYPHTIEQSLRFEDGDNPKLSLTPSSAGNQKTWTWSGWVKRGNLGSEQTFFMAYKGINDYVALQFDSGDEFNVTFKNISQSGGSLSTQTRRKITTQKFRDIAAWYNIIVKFDAANTNCDIYINGTEVTDFSVNEEPQNLNFAVNDAYVHYIGASENSVTGIASTHFDGYLAEVNLIDGSALDENSFGETKAGIWIPKDTSGLTFGTNGFRLKFQDNSSTSTLGDDTSGNGNDYSSSGLATTDVVLDSPTNNFATMNVNDGNGPDMQEGNLKPFGDTAQAVFEGFKGTFPMSSGKWYWEMHAADVNNLMQVGITPTIATGVGGSTNLSYHTDAMVYNNVGSKAIGTGGTGTSAGTKTTTSYGNSYTDGDIIGVALDLDSSTTTLTFYKNNSSEGTAFSSLASDEYVALFTGIESSFGIFNFGQDSSFAGTKTAQGNKDDNGNGDFYYTPPSGYLACCSASLPDPDIDPAQDEEPADFFNTVLWTGNDVDDRAISSVGFQPNWVWIKNRDVAEAHNLYDVIRGAEQQLYSNSGDVEFDRGVYGLKSFTSNGFTLGTGGEVNDSSEDYVAWNWLAGGSPSSNSNGSITSSVSANTKAGFSIVTYTGNATAGATVGHGLSKTPEMYIVKSRSLSTGWVTYHKDMASSPEDGYLVLNGSDAFFDTIVWNDTPPTSSVFSLAPTGYSSNNASATYVAYCFHSVAGYSSVGGYTGAGTSSGYPGPYIYTGFRPAWVMVKRTDSTGNWWILDNKRDPYNEALRSLRANGTDVEDGYSGNFLDFYSNGFGVRTSGTQVNASGGNYVYLAFADQPFKYSNAR
jgi:hypothetical protein